MRLKLGSRVFWLYFAAISAWVLLYLIANNKTDWDLWGVMSFGALLEQNPGRFPYLDPFSYTAYAKPWIYHEWGSGVIFYQLFRHWGSSALFWFKFVLVELIFLFACRPLFLRAKTAHSTSSAFQEITYAFLMLISAYLLLPMVSITIRCQLFTFLGFALLLVILERFRQPGGTKTLGLIPPLMLVWVNLHGGFIIGLFTLMIYGLHFYFEKRPAQVRQLGMVLGLSVLTVIMNPYGFAFISTMLAAWTLPRTGIVEWGNVFTLDIPWYGNLYTLLLVTLLGLSLHSFRATKQRFPAVFLLLAATGIYGWLHYKLAPLFLITGLSLGFELLPANLPLIRVKQTFGLKLWATLGLPLMIFLLGSVLSGLFLKAHPQFLQVQVQGADAIRPDKEWSHYAYPIGVARFLKENRIQGNLWVPFAWGEFLYWVLYPECRISMDGRYETVYPQSVHEASQRFYYPPYEVFWAERYPTTHILVEARKKTLIQNILRTGHWHPVYQDALTVLFTRHPHRYSVAPYTNSSDTLDHYLGNPQRFRFPAHFP